MSEFEYHVYFRLTLARAHDAPGGGLRAKATLPALRALVQEAVSGTNLVFGGVEGQQVILSAPEADAARGREHARKICARVEAFLQENWGKQREILTVVEMSTPPAQRKMMERLARKSRREDEGGRAGS